MAGSPREPSAYLRRLPIGESLPLGALLEDELFPLEGEIRVKPLAPPLLPEPARRGERGSEECRACAPRDDAVVWENERWQVRVALEPHGLPMVAVLQPRAHHDLDDLPAELAAELGIMLQRTARAIERIEGVGRVHVNRWGDGSEHFHVWFLARPYGMWQMRGAMLAVWDDLLPRVPTEEWDRNREVLAATLAGWADSSPA